MNKKTQKKYVALLTLLAWLFVQCFVQTLLRQTLTYHGMNLK